MEIQPASLGVTSSCVCNRYPLSMNLIIVMVNATLLFCSEEEHIFPKAYVDTESTLKADIGVILKPSIYSPNHVSTEISSLTKEAKEDRNQDDNKSQM